MRTLLGVGFDRLDTDAMSVKGPGEANTVWIGRRCDAQREAVAPQAAGAALKTVRSVPVQPRRTRPSPSWQALRYRALHCRPMQAQQQPPTQELPRVAR